MNSIDNILQISMENIRGLADANTSVGTPISLPNGGCIIPVSKVGMGLLSGGSDIPTKTPIKKSADDVMEYPFGGTCALGMGLTPQAFLLVDGNGVRILPVEYTSPLDRLIDTILPVVDSIVSKCKCAAKEDAE